MEALEATIVMGSPSHHVKSRPHVENLRRSDSSPALGQQYWKRRGSGDSDGSYDSPPRMKPQLMRSGSRLRDDLEGTQAALRGPKGSPQEAAAL